MLRHTLALTGLFVSLALTSAGGCRNCSNCHDYDPPVANCDCGACGTQRAGSTSCGCGCCGGSCAVDGQYAEGPTTEGEIMEGEYAQQGYENGPTPAHSR